MRVDLITPFAEKDAVKALGARWDATKKAWYITDVADLAPFVRWISNGRTAQRDVVSRAADGDASSAAISLHPNGTHRSKTAHANPSGGIITQFTTNVALSDCPVLLWVDCEHTQSV